MFKLKAVNKFNFFVNLTATFLCGLMSEAQAQNIGMNGTGANAHPSALVDIDASPNNNTGFLLPRIPLQAINLAAPVTSPATSLLVYNTASASTGTNAVSPGYYYWDGAKWVRFAYNQSGNSANDWSLLGNAGTNATTNFLGTTDAQSLVFRTNNLEAVRITTAGNVGIGTSIPQQMLHIEGNNPNLLHLANTTSSFTVPTWQNVIRFSDGTTMAGYVGDGSSNERMSLVGHWNHEASIASYSTNASISENSSIILTNTSNSLPRSILFRTSNLQRAIIDDAGNMGIGTTTPTVPLQIGNAMHFGRGGLTGNAAVGSDIAFTGAGVLASQSQFEINIDSDNSSTTDYFSINKDADFNTPTQLFKVQENGRIGIGTGINTVDGRIHILADNTTNLDDDITIESFNNTAATSPCLIFKKARGNNSTPAFLQAGDILGGVNIYAWNGTNMATRVSRISTEAMGVHSTSSLTTKMEFEVTNILSNSVLLSLKGSNPSGIGTSTAPVVQIGPKLFINEGNGTIANGPDMRFDGNGLITANQSVIINIDGNDASSSRFFRIAHDSHNATSTPSLVFQVNENGNTYNTSGNWIAFSDARIKTIKGDFTDGLNVINKIKPIKFDYNANAPFNNGKEQIGVVAQELEKIAPYMVEEYVPSDGDKIEKGLKTVNPQAYTFLLINAVKEQQAQIEELKKEIELLKRK